MIKVFTVREEISDSSHWIKVIHQLSFGSESGSMNPRSSGVRNKGTENFIAKGLGGYRRVYIDEFASPPRISR